MHNRKEGGGGIIHSFNIFAQILEEKCTVQMYPAQLS